MSKTESRDRYPSHRAVLEQIKKLRIMIATQTGQLEARPDAESNPQIKEQIHSSFIYYGALGDVLSIYPEEAQSKINEEGQMAYKKSKDASKGRIL